MNRAKYLDGIEHIALNDDPSEMDPDLIQGTLTVGLLSAIFNVPTEKIAKDVVKFRKTTQLGEAIVQGLGLKRGQA